ncbi:MAG TPA: PDDEXK nuclease domain-containing protein [Chitinophaga sp.]
MAKERTAISKVNNLEGLAKTIQQTNQLFLNQVQRQVNTAMTLRNWMIGYHIFEYEQKGEDRAQYGERLYRKLAERLRAQGIKGLSYTALHLYKQFYLTYPQIVQTASEYFQVNDYQLSRIVQTVSEQFDHAPTTPTHVLINKLSFSHFVELIKCEMPLKRVFYETETIKNDWPVRELQRAINSMLFERTGLSSDKRAVLESFGQENGIKPDNFLRNPYVLEFLGLQENLSFQETDLEGAIINHLQNFLLEMGRGFCFEARQKRITFDNTHYRIDLVFYHRILKCHILLDLKLGDFTPADAGQMNVYLNYYKENEMQEGDTHPIGIILCAGRNETLVKYATAGLPQKVFVSKYLINLPSEKQLKEIIEEEQGKIQ